MVTETSMAIYRGTEIGVFPNDWQIVSIGDHFDFKNGLNKEKKFFGTGTPIVNYMDVYKNSGICKRTIKGKVTVSNDELRAFEVRKGDVLFTRTSETIEEIGMSSVIIEDVTKTVFSGFLLRGRPKTNLFELNFKKYCFRSQVVRKQIISTSSQTTRALTNGRLLSNVLVPLPMDHNEQYRIAEVLSDTDELIEQMDRLIVKKKNIKQGAMQELLTGKRRLPGFKKEWITKEVGQMASVVTGGTPDTRISEYWDGNIRWMNSGELNNKKIYEVEGRITELGLSNSSTRLVPEKSVLIGLAGQGRTRGTVAINFVPLCINQSIASILPNEYFIPEFLYYNLDNRYNEIRSMSTSVSGRASLNLGIIKKIPITIPQTKEEQSAIHQVLSDIDSEIEDLNKMKKKYVLIKNGLMQQLLTGRIRLL